jgi:hypothetical protein
VDETWLPTPEQAGQIGAEPYRRQNALPDYSIGIKNLPATRKCFTVATHGSGN